MLIQRLVGKICTRGTVRGTVIPRGNLILLLLLFIIIIFIIIILFTVQKIQSGG